MITVNILTQTQHFDLKVIVEQALLMQKVHNAASGGTANKPGSDPHMGLKDILPEKDKLLMMDCIYQKRNN
jgi:hypothetical protein